MTPVSPTRYAAAAAAAGGVVMVVPSILMSIDI